MVVSAMKIMGLTGGIASGKSTVSKYLKTHGIPVIDADQIAREVVAVGSKLLTEIKQLFGSTVINNDGSLNRKALGAIVFSEADKLHQLNELMDPYIRAKIMAEFAYYENLGIPLICLDAPTLFEAGYAHTVDYIVVVYIDEKVQQQRLMARDSLDLITANQRIQSQISLAEKCQKADYIIDNQGDLANTYQQVDKLLQILNSLS